MTDECDSFEAIVRVLESTAVSNPPALAGPISAALSGLIEAGLDG